MKALTFSRFGEADVLSYTNHPMPEPGPQQALVRMSVAGLNFADIYRRRGTYHLAGEAPWILGYEGSGVIESVGPDATAVFKRGDRVVFADSPHANAQYAAVDVDRLIPLPDDIDFDTASALALQGLTAHYLVNDSYATKRGDWAVVHAAAGGVGLLLIQLLKLKGVFVVAVASSAQKQAACRRVGADVVTDGDRWDADAKAATGGHGPDVIYDSVGTTLGLGLTTVRTGGTVVFFGMSAGNPAFVDPRHLMDRSLTLTGGDLWNVLTNAEQRRQRAKILFDAVRGGRLKVAIADRFPLEQGARAHRFLESRSAVGKVLLDIP